MVKNTNTAELTRLFKVSLISFIVLFIGLELVDNMKELWGRVRPYELSDKGALLPIGLPLMAIQGIVHSHQDIRVMVPFSCFSFLFP